MARILICEDERHLARLFESSLSRQGHQTSCVYSGREAIATLEREAFDVAVVDRTLPDMDGRVLVAWIRAHAETQSMRVVLMGQDEDDGPSGPDLVIAKPFSPVLILSG